MLTIKKEQEKKFFDASFTSFENAMLSHVMTYYPNHYLMMKEPAIRQTIRVAFARAGKYGFDTQRNVCQYLNIMLILGSGFDQDPQYPWAEAMLKDTKVSDPTKKIDGISDKTLEVFGHISGAHHKHLNKALLNFCNNSKELFDRIQQSRLSDAPSILEEIFPRKAEIVGGESLQLLLNQASEKSKTYGITLDQNTLVLLVFMFLSGAGFDKDPQFPWASEILADQSLNQDQKIKAIWEQAVSSLTSFMTKYSPVIPN